MSRNDYYITNLLPVTMERIEEAVDQNKQMLHEVKSKFRALIELIREIIYWVSITKHSNENELERVQPDLKSLSGRRKTWQDVERTSALSIVKGNYLEVIKALSEGGQELENLKRDWTKLMEFYSKMDVFISLDTENSIAFIEFVRRIATVQNDLDDDEIFGNLLDKIQKTNEASFLVYRVCDMYVNVSKEYIMDRIAANRKFT
jgi:hypothetical protein